MYSILLFVRHTEQAWDGGFTVKGQPACCPPWAIKGTSCQPALGFEPVTLQSLTELNPHPRGWATSHPTGTFQWACFYSIDHISGFPFAVLSRSPSSISWSVPLCWFLCSAKSLPSHPLWSPVLRTWVVPSTSHPGADQPANSGSQHGLGWYNFICVPFGTLALLNLVTEWS